MFTGHTYDCLVREEAKAAREAARLAEEARLQAEQVF